MLATEKRRLEVFYRQNRWLDVARRVDRYWAKSEDFHVSLARRDTVTGFLKAYLEGVRELKVDKEFAIFVIAKYLRMDPKKVVRRSKTAFKKPSSNRC